MHNELVEKAEKLLEIKRVKEIYEKALTMEHTFEPESNPIDKAYMLKEVILRLGQAPEIEALAEKQENEMDVEIPKNRTKEAMEDYAKNILKAAHKQTMEVLMLGLQLHDEGRLEFKWPGHYEKEAFLHIGNYKPYYEFTKMLAAANFKLKEGDKWPSSSFSTVNGEAQLKPREADTDPMFSGELEKYQTMMQNKVLELEKHGHLTADVFDILVHKWLQVARHPDAMVTVSINDFLHIRGLKPFKRGDRRSGYTDEQRKQIARQLDVLDNIWIKIAEMDVYPRGEKKKKTYGLEGRSILTEYRGGQTDVNGNIKPDSWRLRPGSIFANYFFEPYGRQTALLSIKAVEYDPYRQQWEKSLTRYLAWIWRTDKTGKRGEAGLLVKTLLDKADQEVNKRNPARTRDRFEKAMDRLQQDQVISGWHYQNADESITSKRGWWKKWLDWKVIIQAPQELIEHYSTIELKK